jgi:IPT/TIG domain
VTSNPTSLIEGLLLAPSAGPPAGGTTVSISAPGVSAATAVHFGSAPASEVEINSPTEITAQAPPGTGTVPVTVTIPEGTTAADPVDQFTYR